MLMLPAFLLNAGALPATLRETRKKTKHKKENTEAFPEFWWLFLVLHVLVYLVCCSVWQFWGLGVVGVLVMLVLWSFMLSGWWFRCLGSCCLPLVCVCVRARVFLSRLCCFKPKPLT